MFPVLRAGAVALGAAALVGTVARRCSGGASSRLRRTVLLAPAVPGDVLCDIDTPALVVDTRKLASNMARLDKVVKPYADRVTVRPIVKAHKCSAIARTQLRSPFTRGVCCAKICEAEAMMRGGVQDIFISNEIIGAAKMRRLAALAREFPKSTIRVTVDNEVGIADLARAAEAVGRKGVVFEVIVEVGVGQERCGVQTADEAVQLARKLQDHPALRFVGVQGYQGAAQHIRDREEMRRTIRGVSQKMEGVVRALREAKLAPEDIVVTGAGSGTLIFEMTSGVYTELQPGSYLFNDVDYSKNLGENGKEEGESRWEASLFLLCTVMSRTINKAGSGWVVIDAGIKAHSIDSGMPRLFGHPEVECVNGGDEHFKLVFPPKKLHNMPQVGEKVLLQPGHCDPTFNMHNFAVAFASAEGTPRTSEGILKPFVDNKQPFAEDVWEIDARSPGY